MRALYTAATGMMAQELNVQVISNNIANLRTTGYKRQQTHFQDLHQHLRRAGTATSDQGTQLPSGIAIGSGVKAASTIRAMSQGNLTSTERDYDVAIRGDGYFRIRMPDGKTAYSRDGSFDLDSQGQLVTRDGYLIEPGITVPQTAKRYHHHGGGPGPSNASRPDGAARSWAAPARALHQQDRPRVDRRQPLPRDGGLGAGGRRQPRLGRLRQPPAVPSRRGECQRGDRAFLAHRRTARLRNEREGGQRRRPDAAVVEPDGPRLGGAP
jgi:hypothetical protein